MAKRNNIAFLKSVISYFELKKAIPTLLASLIAINFCCAQNKARNNENNDNTMSYVTYSDDTIDTYSDNISVIPNYDETEIVNEEDEVIKEDEVDTQLQVFKPIKSNNNIPTHVIQTFQQKYGMNNHRPFSDRETVTERMAYLAEDILNLDSPYINYQNYYNAVDEVINSRVTNEYKLEYVKKLYDLSNNDLFVLYKLSSDLIQTYPNINYDELINEILPLVFDKNALTNKYLEYINDSFGYNYITNVANLYASNYAYNFPHDYITDYIMNCLFARLVYNTPEDFMVEYVKERHQLSDDIFTTIFAINIKEANKRNLTSGYIVANIFYNRSYVVERWYKSDGVGGDDGRHLYLQISRPNQSTVFENEWYLDAVEAGIENFEAYKGVLEMYYYCLRMTNFDSFVSKGSSHGRNEIQYVENDNWYGNDISDEITPYEDRKDYFIDNKGFSRTLN